MEERRRMMQAWADYLEALAQQAGRAVFREALENLLNILKRHAALKRNAEPLLQKQLQHAFSQLTVPAGNTDKLS
jgi:hypothetical protein